METGSWFYNSWCFYSCWRSTFFYAFPPFALILKGLRKITDDSATGILVFPYWPGQPRFPLLMSDIVFLDPFALKLQISSPASQRPYTGGRDALRAAFKRLNTPDEALDLILGSISDNTMKQYSVTYKYRWRFCLENNLNTFETSVSSVIAFLVDLFHKGASYGAINSHRSALSLLLGNNIGADDRIKRLLKGIYRQKPSRPKYM